MSDSNKETAKINIRRYAVTLEKSYNQKPKTLSREQRIHKAIDLLKTWRSIYGDLETESAFRPLFAVVDALQDDQFESE